MTIRTYDQAIAELEAAQRDTAADFGEEYLDEAHRDLVVSVVWGIADDEVAREFCRTQLGYIPFEHEERLGARDYLDS